MQSIVHRVRDISSFAPTAAGGRLPASGLFVALGLGSVLLIPAVPGLGSALILGLVASVAFVASIARQREGQGLWLGALMLLQLGFWIAFARIERIVVAVADVGVAKQALEFGIVGLVLLAPIAAGIWKLLDRCKLEPSPAAKIAFAYVVLAIGCTLLGAGIECSPGKVGPVATLACAGCLSVAALCVGPTTIAAILERKPTPQTGAGLISWIASFAFARSLGSWAQPGSLPDGAAFDACLTVGFGAIAVAVLSSFTWIHLAAAEQDTNAREGGQGVGVPRRVRPAWGRKKTQNFGC